MRKIVTQAFYVFVLAAVIGLVANLFHPKAIAWSWVRPVHLTAQDSLFAVELPVLGIKPSHTDSIAQPKMISREALVNLINRRMVQLIDARTLAEYAAGHIAGAIALPFEQLQPYQEQLAALPRNRWLVTYCDGPPCDQSHLLAQLLLQQGYRYVAVYDAGVNDWIAGKGTLVQENGHE